MANERLNDLFNRFINKQATIVEKEELMELMAMPANEQQVEELFQETWEKFDTTEAPFTRKKSEQILQGILH